MLIILLLGIAKTYSLSIDDTSDLKSLNLTALPPLFGYSVESGLEKYPNFYYQPCEEKFSVPPQDSISINYTSNTLEMSCKSPANPFVVVPSGTQIQIGRLKDIKYHTVKLNYTEPLNVSPWVDYAIGSCFSSMRPSVNLRFLMPRTKFPEYYSRLHSKSPQKKPMIMLLITADSFSRRHFYRKLNKTISFLRELKDFSVFDFKLHNIIGTDTAENQLHLFGEPNQSSSSETEGLGSSAIWKLMKERGFMTLWGTDGCASNIQRVLGTSPEVDHIVGTFFCANKAYGEYSADKSNVYEQRCLGMKMSHKYLMDYSIAFSENYKKASQWIYNHYTAAHEASGQHAQTLDADLYKFLNHYLRTYNATHEVVILLNGDHGMRYGGFMENPESTQEYRLPGSFIIISKFLMSTLQAEEILTHNTLRLNSKPDLRESMIYLSSYQSGVTYKNPHKNAYNMFTERIPNSRSCIDAEIKPWLCSTFYPFTSALAEHQPLLATLQEIIIDLINSAVFTRSSHLCRPLLKGEIIQSHFTSITTSETLFKILLSHLSDYTIQVWVFISTSKLESEQISHDLEFPSMPLLAFGRKSYMKIVHFLRLDKSYETCERSALKRSLNPKYCIC